MTLIRKHLQKQSDLGLHCLSKPFWQATSVGNFRTSTNNNIISVNEKLPASKFQYFGKYIIQLFGYCYDHVSGQSQTGLER